MWPFDENFVIHDEYVKICGLKYNRKIDNYNSVAEVFGRKFYEFGHLDNCIFIDVGANIGDSALYAANQDNINKVYSYEPFKNTFDIALDNLKLNPELSNKIKLFNFGWSDSDNNLTINVSDNINLSACASTDKEINEYFQHEKNCTETVSLKKSSTILKEIINENPTSNIILKMDIEGSEYACMKDLQENDLLKHINILFLEWHFKGYKQFSKMLEEQGFIWFNECITADIGFLRCFNTNRNHKQTL